MICEGLKLNFKYKSKKQNRKQGFKTDEELVA
jgi:hypothetical protein